MGESVVDVHFINANSGTRRCDCLSPHWAADGEERGYGPGEAEWRRHQKSPLVAALFAGRRTTRNCACMPTLTPDGSPACTPIVGLKSQRSRRANLRGKRDSPE